MSVTIEEDDFIEALQTDRATALWRVFLSDGQTVIMDDHRPGVSPHSAWIRLASHCKNNGLSILRMTVGFRDNVIHNCLPEKAEGYYFCKSILGGTGSTTPIGFYIIGYLKDGQIYCQKWSVPDLQLSELEVRPASEAGESLIVNGPTAH